MKTTSNKPKKKQSKGILSRGSSWLPITRTVEGKLDDPKQALTNALLFNISIPLILLIVLIALFFCVTLDQTQALWLRVSVLFYPLILYLLLLPITIRNFKICKEAKTQLKQTNRQHYETEKT